MLNSRKNSASLASNNIGAAAENAMIRRKILLQTLVAVIGALSLPAFAALAPAHAAGLDPSKMSVDEIKAIEQRLTDAGCYKGAIDGLASGALDEAIKACPDQRPFLRIETGMHTTQMRRIGVDAACSLLATASDDKTVRLWSLPDGKLNKVVRLPIGDGNAGKIRAAALSPDGRWLAAGGSDAAHDKTGKDSLRIVDLSTGAIRRYGEFENGINHIAFSANGRRIAIGLRVKNGVRVLDRVTAEELLADPDYADAVYGLAFAPDGALVTSSDDGQLRRYGPDHKLPPLNRTAPDGKVPYSVAIDPSGRRVAVGYDSETPVSILDAKTLEPLAKAQTSDVANGDLAIVAWSRDGATLVAGGAASQEQSQGEWRRLLRFDANGRRQGADVGMSANTIMDIQPCGEGFAFAAGDPAFGLLSPQGVATTLQGPRIADMRGKKGSAFAISQDTSSVRFGLGVREKNPVVFDLTAASLSDSPNLPAGFAQAKDGGLPVTDWENTYAPKFNGAKITLDSFEVSRALAIRPDASGFVLGTEYWVRAYDAEGKQRWKRAGPAIAWGVDFSTDGEIVAVAYDDGTIRWLRWSDGEELLAFFVEPQSRKWAWTPSGYYMASAGGEDLIGWHVNRGCNQQADLFPPRNFAPNTTGRTSYAWF
jgi:WD40 repeat protein